MPNQKACPDQDFIRLFESVGPTKAAQQLGITLRKIYERRRNLEKTYGPITAPKNPNPVQFEEHPQRACFDISDGHVVVFSDAHYWPNYISTAHKFLLKVIKDLKPKVVIANGDVMDGARISRFPPINWTHQPELYDELEAVKERLDEVKSAAKNAKLVWTLGNHDARFETKLATVAPEFADIYGTSLHDHIPEWRSAWSCWVNDDVVIKHRFKGGLHAPHNNTLWSGKHIVTGHLHSQKVMPISDYNGTRYGVDCGTLADPYGPQFNAYTEDNPLNWRSGFCVLTFHKGKMLQPTLATVVSENVVDFPGPSKLIEI